MRAPLPFLPRCLAVFSAVLFASLAYAQQRPYIGYVYPAGGQQGTTFKVHLGGQGINDVVGVVVSGKGVKARVLEYLPRLNNQEMQLLREQLNELRNTKGRRGAAAERMEQDSDAMMMMAQPQTANASGASGPQATRQLVERLQGRLAAYVQNPACASISNVAIIEVEIAANADPGDREIRLSTLRGVTNPMVFQVGTLHEYTAKPMTTSPKQVLGKEAEALRKRTAIDGERDVDLPCTVNGQLGPGEVNRYHFRARKGQTLVFSAECRHLIPYIADAVPGWFQAVLSLHDSKGREISYNDDYGFRPDPMIRFTVPEDGEYTLAINDAIYRGREDFVYRISMGELPFVTSRFPAGGNAGAATQVTFTGVNLPEQERQRSVSFASPGTHALRIKSANTISNALPFAVDTLPSVTEAEGNDTEQSAQVLTEAVIVDGRIDKPGDADVFQVSGTVGDVLAVEVMARRLDSPLDSFVTLSDAEGKVVAVSDDSMDVGDGENTHHADSSLLVKLPATGKYFVRLTDRANKSGPDFVYRLRIGPARPDFELRVVPSSLSVRYNGTTPVTVYVLRKDGYDGPVRLTLDRPPPGFYAAPVVIPRGKTVGKLALRAPARPRTENFTLRIAGTAKIDGRDSVRIALAAEDKMQAFLWRHLMPAGELIATVFDPAATVRGRRPLPTLPPKPAAAASPALARSETVAAATTESAVATSLAPASGTVATAQQPKAKFTKQQVAGRLRQLRTLYETGFLTDSFYLKKVEECEAAQ